MSQRLLRLTVTMLTGWALLSGPDGRAQSGGASPTLQADPPALHFTPEPGAMQTRVLRLHNPTDAPIAWTISERSDAADAFDAPTSDDGQIEGALTEPARPDASTALETLAQVDWTRPHAPDTLIVGFRPGHMRNASSAAAKRQSAHREAGAKSIRAFRLIPADVVRIPPGQTLKETAERYARLPDVEYVSPSYGLRHCATPNDARFGEQWNLDNGASPRGAIAAARAWNISSAAEDVIIAILDTGVAQSHSDLRDNLWINAPEASGLSGVDDDGNGIVDDVHGACWTNGDGTVTSGNPQDGHGHGTHVAGIAGAVGNNAIGVAGVAWRVRLMALKMLKDSGDGQDSDAVAAIEYAVENGARIINASWGSPYRVQALERAIDAARRAGVLFVTAAGNANANNDVVDYYPANYDVANIIAVANSTSLDSKYSSSNYGPTRVHLAAPGAGILSCFYTGGYSLKTGTSMSTPHVSGVAALLLDRAPEATMQELKTWLLEGADPVAAWSGLTVTGARLNAAGALAFVHIPWLNSGERSGVLAPGETTGLEITAMAPADSTGDTPWAARLILTQTDPGHRIEIPVTLATEESTAAGYWLLSSANGR